MRRLYSLVLMAVGLLIGTSVWANLPERPALLEGQKEIALKQGINPEASQMAEPQPFAMVAAQGVSARKLAPRKAVGETPQEAQAKVYLQKFDVPNPEVSTMSIADAFTHVNNPTTFGKYDTVVVELQGDVLLENITGSYGFTLNANKTMLLELNGHSMVATINQGSTAALICNKGRMIINDNTANEKGVGNGKISFYSATVDEQGIPAYASNAIRNEGTLVVKSALIENLCKGGGATYCIDHMQDTLIIDNGKLYSYCDCVRQWVSSETRVNYFVLNGGVLESSRRPMWTHLPSSDATKAPKAETYFCGGELIGKSSSSGDSYNDYTFGNQLSGVKISISGTKFEGDVSLGGGATAYGVNNCKSEELNILGGEIPGLSLFSGYQTVNISDGHIAGDIAQWYGNTKFNISGGTIDGYLAVCDGPNNEINISGNAKLGGYIYCQQSSNTNINLKGGRIGGISVYVENQTTEKDTINITAGTCGYIGISDVTNSALSITDGFLYSDIQVLGETNTAQIKGGFFAYDSDDGYYYCHYGCDNASAWPIYIADGFTKIANYDEGGQQIQWPVADNDGYYGYYWKIGQETKPAAVIDEEGKIVIPIEDGEEGETREPEPTDNIIITKNNPEGEGDDTQFGRYTIYLNKLDVNGITFAGRDTVDVIAKKGSIVNVGSSGIKASDTTTVYMTVEGGGAMKVGVEAIQNVDTVIVKSDANGNGTLLISPNAQLTDAEKSATVKLYVDGARKVDDTHYVWQHIAVPTDGTGTIKVENDRKVDEPNFLTHVQWWDDALTTADKWHQIGDWSEMNHPWRGYILTTNSTTPSVTYSFTGNIIGNNDGKLHFDSKGYNFFGNSFTAPINVQTMLNGISNGEDIEMTVWIYSAEKVKYLESNNLMRLLGMAEFDQISSMQGFWLRNMTDSYGMNSSVNYTNAVWNNPGAMGNPKVHAPARRKMATDMGLTTAQIIVSAEGREDKLALVEGSDYTEGFDNGSDASKMLDENSFNIYASTGIGNLACVATDNIAGTILSFKAAKAGEYTMSFANLNGEKYAIYDMQTGIMTDMTEGNALTFTANAGMNEGRFMVTPVRKISTGNETIKAASKIKGVYTLLGQFVAPTRDWAHLPAGVYVVDGQKVVK